MRLAAYGAARVELLMQLLGRLATIPETVELARATGLALPQVLYNAQMIRTWSLLLRRASAPPHPPPWNGTDPRRQHLAPYKASQELVVDLVEILNVVLVLILDLFGPGMCGTFLFSKAGVLPECSAQRNVARGPSVCCTSCHASSEVWQNSSHMHALAWY